MSVVIGKFGVNSYGLGDIVRTDDGSVYWVDTTNTFDHGPETMVFPFNEKSQEPKNMSDLFCRRYPNMKAAADSHHKICSNLEAVLGKRK